MNLSAVHRITLVCLIPETSNPIDTDRPIQNEDKGKGGSLSHHLGGSLLPPSYWLKSMKMKC